MLPQQLRLPAEDIRMVRTRGVRITTHMMTAYVASSPHQPPRFSVQVPAKGRKNAVTRNRIKRIIREAVRLEAVMFPGNRSVILIPQRHEGVLTVDEARAAVREIAHKAMQVL